MRSSLLLAYALVAACAGAANLLAGCATKIEPAPPSYGELAGAPVPFDQKMASDVIARLQTLHPPAHTVLALQHGAGDPFGSALVSGLRAKGYAVAEAPSQAASAPAPAAPPGALSLGYVIDLVEPGLYRASVTVGSRTLSRVYAAKGDSLAPAGPWSRKE